MRDDQAARLREGRRLVDTPGLTADDRITGGSNTPPEGQLSSTRVKFTKSGESAPANSSISRSEMSPPASAQQMVSKYVPSASRLRPPWPAKKKQATSPAADCRSMVDSADNTAWRLAFLSVISVTLSASKVKASTRSWAQASPSGRASGNVTQ